MPLLWECGGLPPLSAQPRAHYPRTLRPEAGRTFTPWHSFRPWLLSGIVAAPPRKSSLENSNADAQILFRVVAEVAHEQAQIAGEAGQVVVQRRIVEELAGGAGVRVEFARRVLHVLRGVAQIIEERIVVGEFAERTLPGANVVQHRVAVVEETFRAVVD